MSLLGLANELILNIAEQIESDAAINRLSRTCKRLYSLLNLYSYKINVELGKNEISALAYGVKHTCLNTMKRAISQGANCNETMIGYDPIITVIAASGNMEMMRLVLSQPSIKVNTENDMDVSALLIAARDGNVDLLKLLLENGADHNFQRQPNSYHNDPMDKPITAAIWKERIDIIRILLECKDLYLGKNFSGDTPLLMAADVGNVGILQLLVECGKVDLKACDAWGRSALHRAIKEHKEDAVRFLIDQEDVDINCIDEARCSPLYYAANDGLENVVSILIERNADINSTGGSTWVNPLFAAALSGSVAIVRTLLDLGARLPTRPVGNPLIDIMEAKQTETALMLLETDWINVKVGERPCKTLLHAASECSLACTKMLLKKDGIVADAKTRHGRTPLHYAASCCGKSDEYKAIVRLLLTRKDVDPNNVDSFGKTPLAEIISQGWIEMALELIEKRNVLINVVDTEGRTPLFLAAKGGHESVVQALLSRNAEVNIRSKVDKQTILVATIRGGFETLVMLLLERNDIDIFTPDLQNRTALWWAARKGMTRAVGIMLERGAEAGKADHRDSTPLNWAVFAGHEEIVRALLACPDHRVRQNDRNGRSAANTAHLSGNKAIIDMVAKAVAAEEDDEKRKEQLSGQTKVVDERLEKQAMEKNKHEEDEKVETESNKMLAEEWASFSALADDF